MKDIVKGLWKWIVWIFILLILFFIILAIRIFWIDKDYDKKDISKTNSSITVKNDKENSVTDTITSSKNSKDGSFGKSVSNGLKKIGNATVQGYKDGEEYNSINFDERFLMYEGEKENEGTVYTIIDLLLENSQNDFYDKTAITAINFADNVSIKYTGDVEEYQNSINNLKANTPPGTYSISFKYGALGTYVNEIVVTKK